MDLPKSANPYYRKIHFRVAFLFFATDGERQLSVSLMTNVKFPVM
jgi:hypothetical protein